MSAKKDGAVVVVVVVDVDVDVNFTFVPTVISYKS